MKIVPASYEILDRRAMNVFQKIEQAGRLAYKSEDKITAESAEPFVKKLTDAGHYPVIEFANIHVLIEIDRSKETEKMVDMEIEKLIEFLFPCKYLHLSASFNSIVLSGTVRVFMDVVISSQNSKTIDSDTLPHLIISTLAKGYKDKFPYKVDVNECYMGGYTCSIVDAETVKQRLRPDQIEEHLMCAVKFIHNRAFTHELIRHRIASFIQESQRYVNYSLGKFGNEVTFIAPTVFFKESTEEKPNLLYNIWLSAMRRSENEYLRLIADGASPQAARTVLPNSCKTEIILFATIEEWRHIFSLRTSVAAEPSMREVMCPLAEEFFSEENQLLWE